MKLIRSLTWLGILLVGLNGCGAARSGGIVDNGNQPRKPNEPQNDPDKPKDPDPSPDTAVVLELSVLGEFLVSVPSSEWKVEDKNATSTVTHAERHIAFSYVVGSCGVSSESNKYGIDIYWCDENSTNLGVGGGRFVKAQHDARDAEVETILKSFRRK